jgi:hypothetical protein
MKLLKATYGGRDCTKEISPKIKNDCLIVRSSNEIIGDTQPGVIKYLEVELEHEGLIINKSVKEGDLLIFPQSNHDKLGIFYSNNDNISIYPAIQASLKSIKNASNNKVDILTCLWISEPKNPFIEYISWTKTHSHLNQLLQIMQLLYAAKEIKTYKYVSFLEHDVLYPEGYFDYPDFEMGTALINMNYMGINSKGYQPLKQRDEPFHQMTMRFEDAIEHCESILANALIINSGLIEPQNLIRKQWRCNNPAIHINHGQHFTSHFSIYDNNTFENDHYWGNYRNNWPF